MPDDPVLEPTEPNKPPEGGEKSEPAKPNPEVIALQKQLDDQKTITEEWKDSAQYYAAQAKAPVKEPAPKPAEDPADDPDTFLDELSTQGFAAVEKRLGKRFGKLEEKFEGMLNERQSGLEKQSVLVHDFPDLSNEKSALFKQTSQNFKTMVERNPGRKDDPDALYDAAEKAKLQLEVQAATKTRRAAGAGELGAPGGDPTVDNPNEISPDGLIVAKALGVSKEDYLKARSGN